MSAVMQQPVVDAARYYIEQLGFGLCAIPPGTKGPRTSNWNTPALYIDSSEKASAQIKPGFGAGIIHAASGTCALDIDNEDYARIMFAEFGIDLDELLKQGLRITSGRKNRAKALFRLPPSLRNPSLHKINWPDPDTGELVTVVEFRAGAVQDVLPPSIHKDTGQPYEWVDAPWENDNALPELPDVIAQMWLNWDAIKPQLQHACPWDKKAHSPTPAPITRHADSNSLSVIDEFNKAHDAANMLEQYGYKRRGKRYLAPNSSTKLAGVIIFEDGEHFYSHHASDIFGDGKRHDAFDIFCVYECGNNFSTAVAKAANILGIQQHQVQPIIDLSLFIENTKKKASAVVVAPKPPQSIPDYLLKPPGVLSDIAEQINTSAQRPQPVFAVNAALSLIGTILARSAQTETGLRSNLYLISLGPTGCGKEHARNYIKNMLNHFGRADQLAGEDIASGQGLMARAGLSPNALFQIDEFGDFLAAATDKNSASHKVLILTNFMKLFSSAGSVITGAEYANQKMNERQIIEYPCINLHGTGTDGVFFDSLKGRHILDGYLNRLLVTQTDTPRPKRQRVQAAVVPCKPLSDWYDNLENWKKAQGGNMTGLNPSSPVTIKMTPGAWELFDELEKRVDQRLEESRGSGLDSLHVRTWEHAAKVALVCGCSKATPVIDEQDAEWAIAYVEYWTERMVAEAAMRIADSEFGGLMNLVLQQITKAGPDGLTHGRTFNHKKLREVQPQIRQQIIAALAENGEINISQTNNNGAGRPSIRYIAADLSNC
ncbi:hypothetical protein A3765_10580 [Oleiphilus sp. HI0130]|nr:hypothetical protein A3765_10580 [Oleiphilus sp. HI0130]